MTNNISLTAGMRQNLTALQNIYKLTPSGVSNILLARMSQKEKEAALLRFQEKYRPERVRGLL